jgi:hypothetical protein
VRQATRCFARTTASLSGCPACSPQAGHLISGGGCGGHGSKACHAHDTGTLAGRLSCGRRCCALARLGHSTGRDTCSLPSAGSRVEPWSAGSLVGPSGPGAGTHELNAGRREPIIGSEEEPAGCASSGYWGRGWHVPGLCVASGVIAARADLQIASVTHDADFLPVTYAALKPRFVVPPKSPRRENGRRF